MSHFPRRRQQELNTIEFYSVDIVNPLAKDSSRRTGRRPGDSGSKAAIAQAARRRFSRLGYDGTTIRAVAEEAGVDPALVVYFFGSKEQLFAACIEWPFDPSSELPAVIAAGPDGAGHRLVALLLETWDAEEGRNTIVALLRAAMSQEPAERQLRAFLETQILRPLVTGLGCDEPDLRASLVAAQLVGLAIARHVLRFEPVASMEAEQVVELVGPAVQRLLGDPLPAPKPTRHTRPA
jgi:AcrR family transcriptional regulator